MVLDLDETLIHFVSSQDKEEEKQDNEILAKTGNFDDLEEGEDDFFYMVRPYCNRFLSELSNYYEIVIFTAAM